MIRFTRYGVLVLIMTGAAASAPSARAQLVAGVPVFVEGAVGLSLPAGEFSGTDIGIGAETGPAFAIGARLEPLPLVGLYGRYRYTSFGCAECEEIGFDERSPEAGWELGLQLSAPREILGAQPWASGALLLGRLQISGAGGRKTSETGTGFAAGAGLTIPISNRLQAAPGIHYRSYPARFELDTSGRVAGPTATRTLDVSHLGFEVALEVRI